MNEKDPQRQTSSTGKLELLEAEYRVGQAVIRSSKRSGLLKAVEGLAGTKGLMLSHRQELPAAGAPKRLNFIGAAWEIVILC